jgi:hypothetical protein
MQPERPASYICTFLNYIRISGEVTGRIRSTSVAASEVMTHDICYRTRTKEPKFETSNNTIKSAYNGISVTVFQMHLRATLTAYEILVQFCPTVFRTLPISVRTSLLRLLLPLVLPLYSLPFVFLLRQPHLRKYTTRPHRNIMQNRKKFIIKRTLKHLRCDKYFRHKDLV